MCKQLKTLRGQTSLAVARDERGSRADSGAFRLHGLHPRRWIVVRCRVSGPQCRASRRVSAARKYELYRTVCSILRSSFQTMAMDGTVKIDPECLMMAKISTRR